MARLSAWHMWGVQRVSTERESRRAAALTSTPESGTVLSMPSILIYLAPDSSLVELGPDCNCTRQLVTPLKPVPPQNQSKSCCLIHLLIHLHLRHEHSTEHPLRLGQHLQVAQSRVPQAAHHTNSGTVRHAPVIGCCVLSYARTMAMRSGMPTG
ncbi:hypothetical protein NEOLEDRAFT_671486 [Neolentinus lepideus HHB14362 ss-1]|uniref:Uncharacterized protein n=1 Tax=Neolentinus lepideus HHB14362 ss-1 TaxID=1314782 RepID=A0A165QBD3_9AGAM|nr:hypothetical protein NEOLEDRAFT_671486 [Neolentinus lepideus HHB14362 ss-1]